MSILKSLNFSNSENITLDFLKNFMDVSIKDKDGLYKIIKAKESFKDEYKLEKNQEREMNFKDKTTKGRFIFNVFCSCPEYIENFGYINVPITSTINKKFHENLAILLTNGMIDTNKYCDILNRLEWLGSMTTNHSGECIDFDSLNMSEKFLDMKNEKYQELIDKGVKEQELEKAEKILIEEAVKEKKNSGMLKMIQSGSKGSIKNNFKVINIGRGLIKTGSGELKIIKSDLVNGNKTSDYVNVANNSILGTYGRSMKTANGGYLSKLVSAGFSYLKVSDVVDCGTKNTLEIHLTESNFRLYLYRMIKLKNSHKDFQELTLLTYKDFLNKDLEMRSPMYCLNEDGFCKTCYGKLSERNNIKTGLNVLITELTSQIMQTSMKSMASAYSDICIKQRELSGKLSA